MIQKTEKSFLLWLSKEDHDFVCHEAFNQRISISEYIRRLIQKQKEQHTYGR